MAMNRFALQIDGSPWIGLTAAAGAATRHSPDLRR
jgi:hypothetical protein